MKISVTAIILSLVLIFAAPGGGTGGAKAQPPQGWVNQEDSVVRVAVKGKAKDDTVLKAHGTAFYIGDGYFVSNDHVIGHKETKGLVTFRNDKIHGKGKVVWSNPDLDIGIFKVDNISDVKDIPAVRLSDVAPGIGEDIETIAYPAGEGPFHIFGKVASKVRRIPHKDEEEEDRFNHAVFNVDQTTIAGESGGPVFNEKGEVVGVEEAAWPVGKVTADSGPPHGPLGIIIPVKEFINYLPGGKCWEVKDCKVDNQ